MTWVRIDDQFADHPKILKAGPMALAVQIRALCYCARHLTDGHLTDEAIKQILLGTRITKKRMIDVGLWKNNGTGAIVHDYLDYNPTRASVMELRAKRARAGKIGGSVPRASPPAPSIASSTDGERVGVPGHIAGCACSVCVGRR